jgi:aminoglycoside/choline kinase family phosphotransferase
MELAWTTLAPVVARVLGVSAHELDDPVGLGGSDRTAVWRVGCGAASYVVKAHRASELAGYARECSALASLTGSGALPDLLGFDDDHRLLVMTDLGGGAHLADALLGDDRELARRRLEQWVDAVATLHASATPERVAAFERSVVRRGALPHDLLDDGIAQGAERYGEVAAELGLAAELADAVVALRRLPDLLGEARVISPGDVCPDNNALVGGRLLLLDLEGAQLLHPAWDVAYLTVPWPSCWCSWAMPGDVVGACVDRYVAATGVGPGFRDDLALTTLAWSVVSPGWFLPRALLPDDGDTGPGVPHRRAMVQHRLSSAAAMTVPAELAAVPVFAARLHAALAERWGAVTLPLGPAWRRGSTLAP